MSHVAGQFLFVAAALVCAAGLCWAVLWVGSRPRRTESGDPVARGREPYALALLVGAVFVGAVAAVLATWPTS